MNQRETVEKMLKQGNCDGIFCAADHCPFRCKCVKTFGELPYSSNHIYPVLVKACYEWIAKNNEHNLEDVYDKLSQLKESIKMLSVSCKETEKTQIKTGIFRYNACKGIFLRDNETTTLTNTHYPSFDINLLKCNKCKNSFIQANIDYTYCPYCGRKIAGDTDKGE